MGSQKHSHGHIARKSCEDLQGKLEPQWNSTEDSHGNEWHVCTVCRTVCGTEHVSAREYLLRGETSSRFVVEASTVPYCVTMPVVEVLSCGGRPCLLQCFMVVYCGCSGILHEIEHLPAHCAAVHKQCSCSAYVRMAGSHLCFMRSVVELGPCPHLDLLGLV